MNEDVKDMFLEAMDLAFNDTHLEELVNSYTSEMHDLLKLDANSAEYKRKFSDLQWKLEQQIGIHETKFLDGIILYSEFLDGILDHFRGDGGVK